MGRKKTHGNARQYGFRMPQEHYDTLAAFAAAKGIDLAALMNLLVAEAVPIMQDWLADEAVRKAGLTRESRAGEQADPDRRSVTCEKTC